MNIKQYRSDIASRQIQIQVINESSTDLLVTSASMESAAFAGSISSPRSATDVPAGLTRDLRVTLSSSTCAADVADPLVTLTWELPDHTSGRSEVTPTDTLGDLTRVIGQECLLDSVREITNLEATSLTVTGAGAESVAELTIDLEPARASAAIADAGSVTIDRIGATVLIQPYGALDWPLAQTVRATDEARRIELKMVPNRCDAHAVAEDKVGTLFPVYVTLSDGRTGRFTLPLAEGLKADLLDFVATHCGLTG